MWAGIALSYAAPALPPSFTILAIAAAEYALAALASRRRSSRNHPHLRPATTAHTT
jgi:zinc/manganese transport system permease protein